LISQTFQQRGVITMFDTRDIASNTATQRPHPGQRQQGREFSSNIMLESLVCDVHWTCFHAATICYLIHAALSIGQDLRLGAWRHLFYDNTKISQLGLRYCSEMDIPIPAQKALEDFLAAQSKALAATSKAISGVQIHASLSRAQLSPLRAPWIDAAQHALRALQQLDSATHSRIPKEYNENERVLSAFLREAIAGQAHRMNEWSEITLPTLAQRRLEPRATTGQACQILTNGGPISALLVNVSRHGLGMSCERPFQTGQQLTIALMDGRTLEGTVVRSHGRSFGLRLNHALSASDPLFLAS